MPETLGIKGEAQSITEKFDSCRSKLKTISGETFHMKTCFI